MDRSRITISTFREWSRYPPSQLLVPTRAVSPSTDMILVWTTRTCQERRGAPSMEVFQSRHLGRADDQQQTLLAHPRGALAIGAMCGMLEPSWP